MSAQKLITDHLDLWTGAIKHKSSTGRSASGKSGKIELTGIKKLRELILELAVRGKLVEQDPSEEPASVLLDRIAEEKTRLLKEGKIKKPKNLKEVADKEKPFGLPEGWAWARMEAVSEYIQRGKGPKYAESGKVRVISQKCVQWSGLDLSTARFVDDNSLNGYQDERYIRKNDILWNSTGTGTVGRAIVVKEPQHSTVVDSHVTIVRPLVAEPCHILNYISSPSVQQRIEPDHENSLVSGSTKQVELNSGSVKLLAVPMPPKAEQHRIVAKVDELMALCDRLEQQTGDQLEAHEVLVDTLLDALTRAEDAEEVAAQWARLAEHFDTLFTTEASIDKLKQAILQLAVMGRLVEQDPNDEPASVLLEKIAKEKARLVEDGEIKRQKRPSSVSNEVKPFQLPEDWRWCKLDEITIIKSGFAYKSPQFISEGSNQVIRLGNVRPGQLRTEENPVFIDSSYASKTEEYRIESGDILITMTGTKGKKDYLYSVIADNIFFQQRKLYLNQRLCKLRTIKASERYTIIALQADQLLKIVFSKSTGTANQANIGLEAIRTWPISLPPLAEQHRIVKKVDELMAFCNQLKARLSDASETRTHLAEAVVTQAVE
ncbi:restriction endonuclease subunit S [Halomonas sp. 18H]|nr:restriction endonuclease subunit S [Halomonas sp. 18H]MCW4148844.1 restriction endonuclease subunit S [Halomonas sp. 18H]